MLASLLLAVSLASCGGNGANENIGEVYDGLVGRWRTSSMPPMVFNLYDDGTGTRGAEPLTWGVYDGTLNIDRDPEYVTSGQNRNEHWDFSIDEANHQLSISSQQYEGNNIDFIKVGDIYPALIGTWAWNGDILWNYSFNDFGGGRRGFEGSMDSFEWGVIDGQLRFFVTMTSGVTDSWYMTIDGSELRLENVLDEDEVFYYTRMFVD